MTNKDKGEKGSAFETLEEKFDRVASNISTAVCKTHLRDMISRGRSEDYCYEALDRLKPLFLEMYEALRLIEIYCQDVEARAKAELTTTKVDAFFEGKNE